MGDGFLTVNLFAADHAMAVSDVKVLIKDSNGNVLYELTTDSGGTTRKVTLSAPDKKDTLDPYSQLIRFSIYDVDVPHAKGFKRALIHGVQVFDKETSILPIQLHPAIMGDTPEENTDEIFIPIEHGVDIDRPPQDMTVTRESNMNYVETTQLPQANEVVVPDYITVHLGSPNAAAANVRVPFIDYVKVICY